MENTVDSEITFALLARSVKRTFSFLRARWRTLLVVSFLAGCIGVLYAWISKPTYTAELTFISDDESASGLSPYATIAAQFGVDIGGGSGGLFAGDNIMEFMKSENLLMKALLSKVNIKGQQQLLINYYIQSHNLRKAWEKNPKLKNVSFTENMVLGEDRVRDSLFKKIITGITKGKLNVEKKDKKLNIVSVGLTDTDELFAKLFVEQMVNEVTSYYVDTRSKKYRQNVDILQHQTDSVKALLTGGIVSVAASNDLNVNPIKQIVRAGVQKKQVDVQVNSALYGELLKNLELSKIALRKETPLIQVIDVPTLPLLKKKPGRLMTGIMFAFAGFILGAITLIFMDKVRSA